MEAISLDKALVNKYLGFLKTMAEDILMKPTLLVEDLRLLHLEHDLFLQRISESRFVPPEFREKVLSLTDGLDVFAEGSLRHVVGDFNEASAGMLLEQVDEYGSLTASVRSDLASYRDRLGSLIISIESYAFWR